jgi:hypothetical protein
MCGFDIPFGFLTTHHYLKAQREFHLSLQNPTQHCIDQRKTHFIVKKCVTVSNQPLESTGSKIILHHSKITDMIEI